MEYGAKLTNFSDIGITIVIHFHARREKESKIKMKRQLKGLGHRFRNEKL